MDFITLKSKLQGDLLIDKLSTTLYATDASVYQEEPDAIVLPKCEEDIIQTVQFAAKNKLPIIPRSAGTSLAGQCVGRGIVVDISKYMNKILDFDLKERTIWVEPGVIRDELNHFLRPHGLFFGPNTSTANRCMIAGMVGNNSCGSSSIKYGSTRDHVLELKTVLSDGSVATFNAKSKDDISELMQKSNLESQIYKSIIPKLSDSHVQSNINKHFPDPQVERRNTGYALDALLKMEPLADSGDDFNLCKLLTGSEGTLAFTTAIKLNLSPLPAKERIVVCPHFNSINEAMQAVPLIMKMEPDMCELMDKIILDCTKANAKQEKNRFFLDGDPQAILMVQFNREDKTDLEHLADQMIKTLKKHKLGYSFPKVYAPDDKRVFELRAAGLGVLANIPGEAKAVACIEDTAVKIEDLANYIQEFEEMMVSFGQKSVFYAHAGAGEIHLRPILDLRKKKDIDLFYEITKATALLVKKYNGSLSGEHGDGRVRAEFIPLMVGKENYELFKEIKQIWDPNGIFNPGKIVNAAPMNSSLRTFPDLEIEEPGTIFRYPENKGIIRAAEKCNGSGDCRKLDLSGGTMCPSYKATRNEKDSTRARANALRTFLSKPKEKSKPFDSPELKEVLDLCISCKACGTECPSNVDMTMLKAEFQYQYQKLHGSDLRSKTFANINKVNKFASATYPLSKWGLASPFISGVIKKVLNVAPKRSLPQVSKVSLRKYYTNQFKPSEKSKDTVYLFCDEFTNYNDTEVGIKALKLLDQLGYRVQLIDHPESGRAAFSKGHLDIAKKCANENVKIFSELVNAQNPLIGIEPSSILSFRDEYPKIVDLDLEAKALELKENVWTIEEFLANEITKGRIREDDFDDKKRHIALHGHCHQKALSDIGLSAQILSIPVNNTVEMIPSGCCGMAGSFGYEKEHYDLSMKIGEMVLFPHLRTLKEDTIVAASGTSCRHQIKDGVSMSSSHPVEILWECLK